MIRMLIRPRFMREHRFANRRLSAYLDSELDAGERERVHAHVGMCPECRRMLAALRRTVEGLRDLHAEPAPGVAEGVIERLRRDT
jgi:anti-sigma factor RsiW